MSEKLVAFFIVKNSKGIVDTSVIHQGVARSLETFGLIIAKKDISLCCAEKGTHSHTIKYLVHGITKTEFN